MRRWIQAAGGAATAALLACSTAGFAQADGESYEALVRQRQELDARIRAMESAGGGSRLIRIADEDPHEKHAYDDHAHDEHGHAKEHGSAPHASDDHGHEHAAETAGEWRWEDPYYPGWWRASDEYQPDTWAAPPSEGFLRDLFAGQFIETHRSSAGTPWVHPFTIEPPQLHRDLFMFYKYMKDAEGTQIDEHELEFHVDWALTRRLGIVLAAPYLGLIGPDEQATGFGDMEIAPRIVLIESERFFLATNIFITVPTGDESLDLGAGETVMSPMLTTWHDLGSWSAPWTNWNTAYLNVGPETGISSGETTMVYTAVFAHSFLGPKLIFPHHHGGGHGNGHGGSNGHHHNGHAHGSQEFAGTISPIGPGYPPGMTSLIFEFNGQSELFAERETYFQLLTGINYILTDSAEVRFGVNLPLNEREAQMNAQYIWAFSFIF